MVISTVPYRSSAITRAIRSYTESRSNEVSGSGCPSRRFGYGALTDFPFVFRVGRASQSRERFVLDNLYFVYRDTS